MWITNGSVGDFFVVLSSEIQKNVIARELLGKGF
jgi:alkylation response protein AidB-like acyl-CoA dehydrogenase